MYDKIKCILVEGKNNFKTSFKTLKKIYQTRKNFCYQKYGNLKDKTRYYECCLGLTTELYSEPILKKRNETELQYLKRRIISLRKTLQRYKEMKAREKANKK